MTSYRLPDGRSVSDSTAFTLNDVQYPHNWLRLSTQADRDRLQITELPPEPVYDQRYYWGPNQPKDLDDLKAETKLQQKERAQSLLRPTDWAVIRGVDDPGKPPSQELKTYRAAVRATSSTREAEIDAVTTVEELVELLNTTITPWPEPPSSTTL